MKKDKKKKGEIVAIGLKVEEGDWVSKLFAAQAKYGYIPEDVWNDAMDDYGKAWDEPKPSEEEAKAR